MMIYFRLSFIAATFFMMALMVLPLPDMLNEFRPAWILLYVLYIQIYISRQFSLIFILIIGLCLDTLLATTLGEHAFALLLTTWIVSDKVRRFTFFPIGQQMLLILLFSFFYQVTITGIHLILGFNTHILYTLFSPVTSMLFWPFIRILGDSLLRTKSQYHPF